MKAILDVCCSARQFWFQPQHKNAVFVDIRSCIEQVGPNRFITINPDMLADFRALPFADQEFHHVVFDPPHIQNLGITSYMGRRFGSLDENWKELIGQGFKECWRVLKINGTLVFKWNEYSIPTSEVLKCFDQTPIYGHKSGKMAKTQWLVFFKSEE